MERRRRLSAWGGKEVYLAFLRIGIAAGDAGREGGHPPGGAEGRARAASGAPLAFPQPHRRPRAASGGGVDGCDLGMERVP